MKMFKRCMAVVLAVCLCITSSSIASAASKTVTVATQAQLNKAVKAGKATAIKIVTKKAVKFTIPAGAKTKNMKLTVNAPKAEIVNKAQFKSITLGGKTVKRYVENGKNNVITITADMASFRVTKSTAVKKLTLKGKKANVQVNKGSKVASVAAAKKGATLNIRVNGSVGKLEALSMAAKINVRGNAKKIPVVIDARNVVLTANATVDVLLKDEAKIVLAKGSEDSTIAVNNSGDAEVVNKTKEDVVVTTPAGEVTVEAGESVETTVVPEEIPEPTPTPSTPSTGGSTGGNSGNGGGSKPTPPPTVKVTGVTVSQAAVTLKVGETTTLTAIVAPKNATEKTVTWSSDNTEVATVDKDGLVTAKAAGEATITVTTKDGNMTDTCTVTVAAGETDPDPENPPVGPSEPEEPEGPEGPEEPSKDVQVESISVDKTAAMVAGESRTLTVKVTPAEATNPTYLWKSSDEAVTVSNETTDTVTLKAEKVGEATITVTVTSADGTEHTANCTVTVADKPDETEKGKVTFTAMNDDIFAKYTKAGWEGLPKNMSDFGSDVTFTPDTKEPTKLNVSGTLQYVENFKGFNVSNVNQQSGYYLLYQFAVPKDVESIDNVVVKASNKTFDSTVFDKVNETNYFAMILHIGEQTSYTISIDWDGDSNNYEETTYTFNFDNLTQAPKPVKGKVTFEAMCDDIFAKYTKAGWEGLPKNMSDFGSDVTFTPDTKEPTKLNVSGTLQYVENFKGFNVSNVNQQSGYYLLYQFAVPKDVESIDNVVVKASNKTFDSTVFDKVNETNYFAMILHIGEQTSYTISIDWDGDSNNYEETTYTFNFDNLTQAPKPVKGKVTFEAMCDDIFAKYTKAGWEGLPKNMSDFGSNVTFTPDTKEPTKLNVSGTLQYVENFKGFNVSNVNQQSGYYLLYQFAVPEDVESIDNVVVKASNKTFDSTVFDKVDETNYFAMILHIGEQTSYTISIDWDGDSDDYEETTYTFIFGNDLTQEEKE